MQSKEAYEHAKWLEENNREDAKRVHDANRDFINRLNEATASSGTLAIRTILIINGGAAIALLSFIGGLVGNGKLPIGVQLQTITSPLSYFAWGVVFSALSMGFAYLTNYSNTGVVQSLRNIWAHPYIEETGCSKRWRILSRTFTVLSICAAIASLGAFIFGMIAIRGAIPMLR